MNKSRLLLLLVLLLSSTAAALVRDLGSATDILGNEFSLKIDNKMKRYIIYFVDKHVVHQNIEYVGKSGIKRFRIGYNKAKSKAMSLRPGEKDIYSAVKIGSTTYQFTGFNSKDTRVTYVSIMTSNTDTVDSNSFNIPIKGGDNNDTRVRKKFERVLAITNR